MMFVPQRWAIVRRCRRIGPSSQLARLMFATFTTLAGVNPISASSNGVSDQALPLAVSSSDGFAIPYVTAASIFPPSGFDWFLRALFGVLAIGIGTACWRRRVGREERQKELEASRLAERTRELALEKQRAEDGNKIKAQFLARISEDIGIPIHEVLHTLERALTTNLTSEQRDLLERSKSSAREVLTRLGGVLDISVAEAEKLSVNRVEFSVRDWIRRLVAAMAARARENGVELQTDIAADFPDQLVGDPDSLRKVLHALIKDAIKFSSPGKVIVVMRLDRRAAAESSGRSVPIFFSVEGRGTNRERPVNADNGASPRDDDAEPVLPFCDRLLGLTGGRAWVYSHEGRSRTCCTVRLETRSNAGETAGAGPAGTQENSKVDLTALLVEKLRAGQLGMLPMLEKQGLHCMVAKDGDAAIALLERFTFGLIVVASQTSNLDGLEASRRIRERHRQTGSHVPILAVTTQPTRADREACLRAGADACVSRSAQPAQLREAIEAAVVLSKTVDAPSARNTSR